MIGELEYFGQYTKEESDSGHLYLLEVPSADLIPDRLELVSRYFICMIVQDALGVSDETLNRTARKLLSNGAVYFCAFGPDCERVHDRIDDQIRDMNLEDNDEERLILTTWHSSEPLEDALWYFLYSSSPSEAYWSQCNSWVLVSIGAHSLSAEIRAAFSNVEQFNETVLAKIPDDEEEES